MSNSYIQLAINNSIATITLNRPEIHNAFDDVLIKSLTDQLQQLEQNNSVRVVLLTANGKSFSAGADMNWMRRIANYSKEENYHDALAMAHMMNTLYRLSKPTIALVQGAAYGGGVGLVACCDIAIATPSAMFCLSEVKLGLIAASIGPYVVAALGERAARRYLLTAERFDAHEAYRLGLIHQVVDDTILLNTGQQMAQQLLNNGPQALSIVKRFLTQINHQSIDDTLIKFSAETIANIRATPEAQEGLSAFLEKRKPSWAKE